jgi:23S rRNA (adenine-N6)-dimethyltransferase
MAGILRHAPPYPVLELGAGNGAITRAIVANKVPVTAVELDPRRVAQLRRAFKGQAEIVQGDMLAFEFGTGAHNVIANVPFSLTTPVLRRLLRQSQWHTAVLLVQWEVARKRAAVGGTTMLTAMWWPWYSFTLGSRVPAAAFAPTPSVDGGILVLRRRDRPFVGTPEMADYQAVVRTIFTSPGRGLHGVLRRQLPERAIREWLSREGLDGRILPRDLTAEHWTTLFRLIRAANAFKNEHSRRSGSRGEATDNATFWRPDQARP